jgi:PPOX class probable F420-dependent enzyme
MTNMLEQTNYVSFSTLRKNGSWVDTPVWFAPDGDTYYIFSAGEAGKVKRLRNFSQCKLAPCTVTGKTTGEQVDGHAWLIDDSEEAATANRALVRKYGWQMRLTNLGSQLTGKYNKRKLIGFKLGTKDPESIKE